MPSIWIDLLGYDIIRIDNVKFVWDLLKNVCELLKVSPLHYKICFYDEDSGKEFPKNDEELDFDSGTHSVALVHKELYKLMDEIIYIDEKIHIGLCMNDISYDLREKLDKIDSPGYVNFRETYSWANKDATEFVEEKVRNHNDLSYYVGWDHDYYGGTRVVYYPLDIASLVNSF